MRLSLFTLINVVVGKLRLSFLSYLVLFKWHLVPLRYHFLISVHMVVTMAILTLKFRWVPFAYLFKYAGAIGYAIVCLFLLAIPQIQFARAKDKEAYYAGQVQPEE